MAETAEMAETNFVEFKGNYCVFVADWLKTKGIYKLKYIKLYLQTTIQYITDVAC